MMHDEARATLMKCCVYFLLQKMLAAAVAAATAPPAPVPSGGLMWLQIGSGRPSIEPSTWAALKSDDASRSTQWQHHEQEGQQEQQSFTVAVSALNMIGSTSQREDPRYFYCMSEAMCFGNFGGSLQTASHIYDGWLAYGQPSASRPWTMKRFQHGPQVLLPLSHRPYVKVADFGDLCAPFATHKIHSSPSTHFSTAWFGIAHVTGDGSSMSMQRQNYSSLQIKFDGLPSPAITFQVYHAMFVPSGQWLAVVGATLYAKHKPPCCNETLFIFHADGSSVSNDDVPLSWHCGAKVMDRSSLSAIGVDSSEGPNEAAFVALPTSGSKLATLLMVVRTDGGDGMWPRTAHKSHRPFVAVRSDDGGRSWSAPRVLGPMIGSARPQLVLLQASTTEATLLLSGGRPGLNLWSSSISGDLSQLGNQWMHHNVPALHNKGLIDAGLNSTSTFCSEYVALSNGTTLKSNWSISSGYTGLSQINATSAMFCYDTADGSTGGYNIGNAPKNCRFQVASVFCMVVSTKTAIRR